MLYPLKLQASLKDYLWGGTKLQTEYHKPTSLAKVAESWEVACHRDGKSIIANGEAKGRFLGDYLEEQGKAVLGSNAQRFPYFPLLVKLIDAEQDLSIQVHPGNDYAMRFEGEYGKTELWYIVDCAPGASLVYGVSREISREEFVRHVREKTLPEICNRVPVKKGDVFFIPAGTLHAIGKGILIAEVQQNSNTSYRVYDYGRKDKDGKERPLHLEKALDVLCLSPSAARSMPVECRFLADCRLQCLVSCAYFTVYHMAVFGDCSMVAGNDSFQALTVLHGEVLLHAENDRLPLQKGESVFLPAGMGRYSLHGDGDVILSMV